MKSDANDEDCLDRLAKAIVDALDVFAKKFEKPLKILVMYAIASFLLGVVYAFLFSWLEIEWLDKTMNILVMPGTYIGAAILLLLSLVVGLWLLPGLLISQLDLPKKTARLIHLIFTLVLGGLFVFSCVLN